MKWTVNGVITPSLREGYYYVPLATSNEQTLLPLIRNGSFIMYYGAWASSKSTHIEEAKEQLTNEGASFQAGVDFINSERFWVTFGKTLQVSNPHINVPSIRSARDFLCFLEKSQHPENTKLVIIIDEFDLLYQAPQQVVDSLLNMLRNLKQERELYAIQSFVGVGPFSILELTGSSSPFNVREAVKVPFFTESQVQTLFKQFSADWQGSFDQAIATDIYQHTKGHPGLVCFCCKALDEHFRTKANGHTVSYNNWLQYAVLELPQQLQAYPTVLKLVSTLTNENARPAREVIEKYLLPSLTPVQLNDVNDIKQAKFLTAEGAAECTDGSSTFQIPSPILWTLLAQVVSVNKRPSPNLPVPWKQSELSDNMGLTF